MIEVEVYLYAYLRRYCPETELGRPLLLTVEEDTSIGQLLERLGIPRESRRIVFVNGVMQGDDYALRAGDRLAVFPPIAGGAPPPGEAAGVARA